jgi:hypothetical protein
MTGSRGPTVIIGLVALPYNRLCCDSSTAMALAAT